MIGHLFWFFLEGVYNSTLYNCMAKELYVLGFVFVML